MAHAMKDDKHPMKGTEDSAGKEHLEKFLELKEGEWAVEAEK